LPYRARTVRTDCVRSALSHPILFLGTYRSIWSYLTTDAAILRYLQESITIIMAKRHGNKSKNPASPTMLPKDLMRSAVLGLSDRASLASFMAVKEISQVFRLHSCFCKDHGTRLGQVCPCMPTGTKTQCADCEMPKIGMVWKVRRI
jgi:hypothetical protein